MKKKVLIVDDDPTSLKVTESILSTNGYEVKTLMHAANIEDKVKGFNPHVIVMDLIMPNVDGTQAVKILQSNPVLKNVPVIFLTAIHTKDAVRGLEYDIQVEGRSYRTLNKPIDPKILLSELENLIKQ